MAFRDPLYRVSVRYKLALMFVGVCLLAFGVGGYLVSGTAKTALEEQILARLEFQAQAHATALAGRLRTLARRTEDFASDGFIRDHAEALLAAEDGPRAEELRAELREHLRKNKLPLEPAFLDVGVAAPDGSLLATARGTRAPLPAAGARDGTRFGDLPAPAGPDGPLRVAIATPLSSRTGSARLGRLVTWVGAETWISDALRSGAGDSLGPSGAELALVDRAGRRLAVTRDASGELELALFDEHAAVAAPRGGGVLFHRAYPIRANGWSVRVDLDATEPLAAVGGLQSRFLLFGVVLTGLASLLLIFPMRFLARPLGLLTQAARRMRDGDFSARVEVESEDEIGELGLAFNAMAEAVEERTHKLERTASDLQKRQRELAFERDRLSAVIASMRDGLIVLDSAGEPVVYNDAAAPLVGRDAPELTSRHRCERAEDAPRGEGCLACLFDPAAPPRSCVVEVPGGTYEVHSTRLSGPGGRDGGRVLVSRDLSDRVAQDERQIHQERLAVLGEVAAVMAHELNNPLAAISLYNQMLAAELDAGGELAENVAVIQRNVDQAKRSIRELLDYATGSTPEVAGVDVGAVLEDVSIFLRPVRERSGVELELDVADEPLLVSGDEVQVRQVFVNLIVNALQAMRGSGGRIRVRARREDGAVVAEVEDDGPGIPAEARDQVFRPFFTTKPRGEGTGLGLPTARRIAEMHGGGVQLVATGPDGTTFRVRLRAAEEAAA